MSEIGAGIIPRRVRRSPAWQSLSPNARKVLVAMARQYDGRNNGELVFEALDGSAIGVSAVETEIALIELERAGLIDSRHSGVRQ